MTASFVKDPDAVLDYKFDWRALTNGVAGAVGDWLGAGETISTSSVAVSPAGLVVDSSTLTDSATSVTVWLSSGTAGADYVVTCRITTSLGRTDERSITIKARER